MKNSNFTPIAIGIIVVWSLNDLFPGEDGSLVFDQGQFAANQPIDICECGGTGCEPQK